MQQQIHSLSRHQAIRYVFIGGVSYVAEVSVLLLLQSTTSYSPGALVGISFWVGLIISFSLQKYITFKNLDSSRKVVGKQAIYYGLLVAFNFIFTIVFVELSAQWIDVVTARTIALVITTIWNYLIYKRLIFN